MIIGNNMPAAHDLGVAKAIAALRAYNKRDNAPKIRFSQAGLEKIKNAMLEDAKGISQRNSRMKGHTGHTDAILIALDGKTSTAQLVAETGFLPSSVRAILNRLCKQGLVRLVTKASGQQSAVWCKIKKRAK